MFPGFVYMYKDNDDYVHLYFFSGINDNGNKIYKDIDLSSVPFKYMCNEESDLIKDYKFQNKTIIKIKCSLINIETGNTEIKILSV